MPENAKQPASIDPSRTPVEVRPNYDVSFQTVYSNHAVISHTGSELCVDFCALVPPHRIDLEKKVLLAPVVSRILIPPSLVEGLINALKVQLKKYKEDLKGKAITVPLESRTTGKEGAKK